jgi:hypothetical protein
MRHEEIAELLGAYALDAVDPDERTIVEEHLVDCARCRAEVAEHREVAALLANSGADAPAGLWDRISGTLEAAPPRLDLAPVRSLEAARRERRRFSTPIGAALVAAAAVVVALLGLQVRDQDHRINQLQTALRNPMAPAFDAALDDPGARVFRLASTDGRLSARGVVTGDGTAYLRTVSLPRLRDGLTYQLWGVAGGDLISLGVLGDRPTVVTFRADQYSGLAITEERAPGVVTSHNQPVVAGGITA